MEKKHFHLLATLFVAVLTLGFASCGGDDDEEDTTDATPAYGDDLTLTDEGKAAMAVDLGLPSGLKWADRNVGSSNFTDYGSYFAWGDVETVYDYCWEIYKYGTARDQLTKYCNDAKYGRDGFTDTNIILDAADDAASIHWGGRWRMPTKADFEELIKNTTYQHVEYLGIPGCKFTNRRDGSKFIFLPSAGCKIGPSVSYLRTNCIYWSSSLSGSPDKAYTFIDSQAYGCQISSHDRSYGLTVRPVCP